MCHNDMYAHYAYISTHTFDPEFEAEEARLREEEYAEEQARRAETEAWLAALPEDERAAAKEALAGQ